MNHLFEHQGTISVLTLDRPPINSLGHALRQRAAAALEAAAADFGVRAIVLTGNEKAFSPGADVREFGTLSVPRSGLRPRLLVDLEKPQVHAALNAQRTPMDAARNSFFG
jgi:3-hydroxyacyl-CoA dehydrogenase